MDTGDLVWGLPYGPHTLAARTSMEPACILALTYGGGPTGDAQRELAALAPEASHATVLSPFHSKPTAAGQASTDTSGGDEDRAQAAPVVLHWSDGPRRVFALPVRGPAVV